MHIIAFITDTDSVRKILDHISETAQPPTIAPARVPPLWEAAMASVPPLWEAAMASEQAVQRPSMGYVGATCTGVRVRSAHHLVTRNFSSPWGGLCAGFGVCRFCRFLALARPILANLIPCFLSPLPVGRGRSSHLHCSHSMSVFVDFYNSLL